jgi:hypothetical protein
VRVLLKEADRVARYFDPTDGGQGDLDGDGKRLLAALSRAEAIARGEES